MNIVKCPSNKNIKLLLQRRKNRPEMKASFLFNILGTIADTLSALMQFTRYYDYNTTRLHTGNIRVTYE